MAGKPSVTEVDELVEALVAHGRTVKSPGGKYCGPGEIIELPAAEVEALTELGFLVDENAVERKPVGPHIVSQGSGPAVRIA